MQPATQNRECIYFAASLVAEHGHVAKISQWDVNDTCNLQVMSLKQGTELLSHLLILFFF